MFTINRDPTLRDLRWFAGAMLAGFPLLALLLIWTIGRNAEGQFSRVIVGVAVALTVVGLGVGTISLVSRKLGRNLYVAWMTLTMPIGVGVSTALLTVLYFVFLPVFSLIVRRHDPLRKKLGGTTYWEDYKPHEPTLERMRRPF